MRKEWWHGRKGIIGELRQWENKTKRMRMNRGRMRRECGKDGRRRTIGKEGDKEGAEENGRMKLGGQRKTMQVNEVLEGKMESEGLGSVKECKEIEITGNVKVEVRDGRREAGEFQ